MKSKAMAKLHSEALTDDVKRKIVGVLDIASTTVTLSSPQVHNLLFDYIEKSTFTGASNIAKFNELCTLLDSAPGREEFEARHLLKRLLDTRLVYERQGTYTWMQPMGRGTLVIGDRYSDAIDFILSPKKLKEVEEMQEQLLEKGK
jgi:hypothetical protein